MSPGSSRRREGRAAIRSHNLRIFISALWAGTLMPKYSAWHLAAGMVYGHSQFRSIAYSTICLARETRMSLALPRAVPTPKQLPLKPEMGTVSSPILSQTKAMAEPQSAGTGQGTGNSWVSLSESLPSIGHPRGILPEAPKRTVVVRCFRNWTLMEALDPAARIRLLGATSSA